MSRLLICAVLCSTAAALNSDQAQGALRSKVRAEGFVQALEFKHRLRVCNAYPYSAALDVYRGTSEKLTDSAPMHYKSCQDFVAPLRSGDKLEFKVGDASAGTFSVADLPQNDAVLLLVIHRHDTLSTAVSFESHVFANLENSQVAIIDTFKGAAKGSPTIMDVAAKGKTSHSEDLRYDSVVAINPGLYNVHLLGADGKDAAKDTQLVALNHESYVIIRTGVEAQQGPAYPQELIIYPNSDAKLLHSSAPAVAKISAAMLALLALSSTQWF
jgi:hypothetical protein